MPQHSALTTRYFLPGCDRIVTGGILFLIIFTPLAFGSVHPWAFSLLEIVTFLLVIVWMGKLIVLSHPPSFFAPRSLFPSLILFISLILFQLLPLPPALLRLFSPATYELYAKSLPGWPEHTPYKELSSQPPTPDPQPVTLGSRLSPSDSSASQWRPLSIAPSLTRTDLLKFLAYTSLFSLVLLYPFGPSQQASGSYHEQENAEGRFLRAVLLTVLCTGLLVTCIGLVQRVTWNGKILWFFVPYDWGDPRYGVDPRANGPFVNPNHFANYLALIFPLALVGILSPRSFVSQERRKMFKLFCGFITFSLLMGILLSLSRGGWVGAAIGVSVLLWIFLSLPEEKRPFLLQRSKKLVVRCSLAGLVLLLALTLVFVGPSSRSQVDVRLEETVIRNAGLWFRVATWKDSVGMIRDFPLFGVGLGAWPELFPRYQRPPWSPLFYSEAHNDYLELVAGTGLIGFDLLAWFFWQRGRGLVHGLKRLPSQHVPVFAALLSALAVMALHECFDFNLQIPANAFLFTLFWGIALRFTRTWRREEEKTQRSKSVVQVAIPVSIGIVAFLLFILSFRQERLPYPYNLKEPGSLAEAREILLSHPALSSSHVSLFGLLQQQEAPPAALLKELEIALWLDPRDPDARDLYATSLLEQGREEEGWQEMSQSVFCAPSLSDHFYLDSQRISQLSPKERSAVEEGFKRALAAGYEGAVSELGAFYTAVGRFPEEAKLYEEAALKEGETEEQVQYFLNAGLAYVRAGEEKRAELLFRRATRVAPQDLRAYQYLVTQIFARQGELELAKAVIAEGVQKGADPVSLFLSLAEGAQKVGDTQEAKAAILQALTFQPASFEAHFRLGLLYLQERNFGRAALSLRKAAEVNPSSASAFYHLGVAEEGRYQFFAAERAYARAIELTPDDSGFQSRYEALQRKVALDGSGMDSGH